MSQSGVPSSTAAAQSSPKASMPSFSDLGVQSTNISTAPTITLSDQQKVIVGSVLDLFAGHPSLKKLGLWHDDAEFSDPLTKAQGRKQFAAQWYGLQTAFSEIERLSHSVTSSGNPISMDLKTRYKFKGIGSEQVIDSKVNIFVRAEDGKIEKVEDKWNGSIPEGPFAKAWRNLNSVTVPAFVGVPKNEEEEAKRGN